MGDYTETSSDNTRAIMRLNPFLSTMVDYNRSLLEHVTNVNHEWAEFMHRRFNDSMATSEALMRASSPKNAVAILSRFIKTSTEDYHDQFANILQMNTKIGEKISAAMTFGQHETDNNFGNGAGSRLSPSA